MFPENENSSRRYAFSLIDLRIICIVKRWVSVLDKKQQQLKFSDMKNGLVFYHWQVKKYIYFLFLSLGNFD